MGCRLAGVALVASLVAVSVCIAGSPRQGIGLVCSEFDALPPIPACGWVSTAGWKTYEDMEHGFAIEYPNDFVAVLPGDGLVTAGAVVTFVPTFDPSVDETGAKTNLGEVSVTIGVVDVGPLPHEESLCPMCTDEQMLDGLRELGGRPLAKCCFSDAGAGNIYEKVSYRIACGRRIYEIALFAHYGNPAFYAEGTITVFDPMRFLQVFDTMVGTFLTLPLDTSRSG